MILFIRVLFLSAVCRASTEKAPPYKSDGECNNRTEFFNKDARLCCSKCNPGTRLGTACTDVQDTVCLNCPDGQYSESMNHHQNCFSCKKCSDVKGLMYERNCSANTKAVCACKPGSFCVRGTSECLECKRHKTCKPGEGIIKEGTHKTNVQCGPCPDGTFSSRPTDLCKQHTRCEGGFVLHPGNSTADTQCGVKPRSPWTKTTRIPPEEVKGVRQITVWITPSLTPLASETSTTAGNQIFVVSKSPPDSYPVTYEHPIMIYIGIGGGVLLILLTLTLMWIFCKLQNRRGLVMVAKTDGTKEPSPPASGAPERQCLLPGDACQKEPSMTSSDSSQSHSSGDWLERTSQEESLHEHPSIPSPLVNLSITATINCQLNPTTASCSIPVSPSTLVPQADVSVPLSQEEVSISCQQEDGKEALQSVQESGSSVF